MDTRHSCLLFFGLGKLVSIVSKNTFDILSFSVLNLSSFAGLSALFSNAISWMEL